MMNSCVRVLMVSSLLFIVEPSLLLAKKDKEPEKDPPQDLIFKYYGRPEKIRDDVLAQVKEEFPELVSKEFPVLFANEFNQAINRPYGSWSLRGIANTDVAKDAPLPFDDVNGMPHLITCSKGIFEFKSNGVFSVTFGIVDSKLKCKFDIQRKLNGGTVFENVPGGTLIYKYENGSSTSLTVLVQAQAGDQLRVMNTSGLIFKLGTLPLDQVFSYISIHQIN